MCGMGILRNEASFYLGTHDTARADVCMLQILLDRYKTTGHHPCMNKSNVRDKILEASLAALHGKGFNATSVQDITDAAKVPKGSFYNHFASKEALGAEVVKMYVARTAPASAALFDTSLAPLERLRRHWAAMVDVASGDGQFWGCLLGNFSTELSGQSTLIRDEVVASLDGWTAAIAGPIADAQADGTVPAGLPVQELAAFIINAWQGALARSKAEHSRAPLDLFMTVVFTKVLA
jgi:TetR/AcrR family transcriptional repressor of nem operon